MKGSKDVIFWRVLKNHDCIWTITATTQLSQPALQKDSFLQHSMAPKAPWLAPRLRHSDDLSPLPNALDKGKSLRGRPETIPVISSGMLLLCLCVCVCWCAYWFKKMGLGINFGRIERDKARNDVWIVFLSSLMLGWWSKMNRVWYSPSNR